MQSRDETKQTLAKPYQNQANPCETMPKPVDAKQRGYPSPAIKHPGSAKEAKIGDEKLDAKDVKEWAVQESTIDKYRERYKEEWESKLKEVVNKMLANI